MKIFKLYLVLFLLVLTGFLQNLRAETTATAPSTGNGSSGNPYQIANLANLRWLSETPSVWVSGTYCIQTADIDACETSTWNSGAGFSPIGNGTTHFSGNYNGNYHVISNLTISVAATSYVGLFGWAASAQLSNLGLTGINVSDSGVAYYIGTLLGGGETNVTISNCFSTGTVQGYSRVGGLIGYINIGSITNCYSTTSVTGTDFLGGLCGQSRGSGSVPVTNCYSTGAINGTGSAYIGGLIGFNEDIPNLTNSYWDSETSGKSTSAGGTGYSTANMKIQSNYSGWNFSTIWAIDGSPIINKGYPYLRGFPLSAITFRPSGNALSFDGSDDYVSIPNNTNLNSSTFTVQAWVMVTGGAGTNRSVISHRNGSIGNQIGYTIYAANDNTWQVYLGSGGADWNYANSTISIVNDKWTNLAVTYNGSTLSLFVDGV